MAEQDTRLCATSSGDQHFLQWLYGRLVNVYGEEIGTDFVETVLVFRGYFERRRGVPRWLNWLLRKYDL